PGLRQIDLAGRRADALESCRRREGAQLAQGGNLERNHWIAKPAGAATAPRRRISIAKSYDPARASDWRSRRSCATPAAADRTPRRRKSAPGHEETRKERA